MLLHLKVHILLLQMVEKINAGVVTGFAAGIDADTGGTITVDDVGFKYSCRTSFFHYQ